MIVCIYMQYAEYLEKDFCSRAINIKKIMDFWSMSCIIVLIVFAVVSAKPQLFDPQLDELWENFKAVFKKYYPNGEELARRLIWEENVADVIRHNLQADLGKQKFWKGINKFSDMRHEEFVKRFTGYKSSGNRNGSTWLEPMNVQVSDSIDWRDRGYVTRVKDQGDCGSCWAFSATGSLEGQQKKKSGNLISLSEQNLVDCSVAQGNEGCGGGEQILAFEYVITNNGIDTEDSYPYTGNDDNCNFKKENVGATCSGYVRIPCHDEDALKKAVATIGPISVSIDASQSSFQFYKNGIYDEPNCDQDNLDHAVLVVGYGTESGNDYWLVKNSWGTSWGDKGYIKMSRNKDNQCGIATEAVYPLV